MAVHVGQQPVLDRSGATAGYELLFRATAEARVAGFTDPDAATASVVVATFLEFGLPDLVGDRLAFLNLPRAFLVGDRPLPFGPEQVVLEVLEDIEVDREVVAGLTRLRDSGYALALDDVCPDRDLEALLPLVDVVKIDLTTTPVTALPRLVDRCAGGGRRLLAEKVETARQLRRCRALGFELFQGYHLGRPTTRSSSGLTPSQVCSVRLLEALVRPDLDVRAVVEVVQTDPAMCLRLLRAANSAASGLSRRIDSVEQALLLLGRRTLQGWAVLMALDDVGDEAPLATALLRARMCQLLAARTGRADPGSAFLTGVLSGLAEPLGSPVLDLAADLPLAPDVVGALAGGSGALAGLLAEVVAWQEGDLVALRGAPVEVLREAYLTALSWTRRVGAVVPGPPSAVAVAS